MGSTLGFTTDGNPLIWAGTHNEGSALPEEKILKIIAHELGHSVGRPGHTPTSDKESLMREGFPVGKEVRRRDRELIHSYEDGSRR